MDARKVLIFSIFAISIFAVCSLDEEVKNGYIFTSPRSLKRNQNNQLQLLRFGCLDDSTLNVQLYYKTYYKSNETLAQQQIYNIQQGTKDSLLDFFVKPLDDVDYIYSGRLQINGTMCGKTISGSDEVHFSKTNANIYIIQTDKPFYKPGQTVKFRVLKIDKNLKPSNNKNDTADVFVEDPKGTRLFQFKGVHLGKGLIQKEFPLADEPIQGSWRITVSKDKDTQSTSFDVKEYKLPKFEVKIKFPSFVLQTTDTVPVSVCAQYTYGQPVHGYLNLNTSLEIYSYESSYSRTPILHRSEEINGCYNYTINITDIDPKRDHSYKRIQVSANVIEDGTGVQIKKTEYLSRNYSPLNMDFNINNDHGRYFKPGLPYNGKLKITNPDGSPAPEESAEICATVSRKRIIDTWLATKDIKFCKNYTSDESGYIKYRIQPQHTDTVSINLNARSLKYTGGNNIGQPSANAFLDPFYSPTGSFVQLETFDYPLPCGTRKNIRLLFTAKENTEFQLQYQILKQGEVIKSGSQQVNFTVKDDVSEKYENTDELINGSKTQISPELSDSELKNSATDKNCPSAKETRYMPPVGEVEIPIDVDSSLSSAFTLLVFYVREDRETVADSQKINVEKCLKNKVNFEFSAAVAPPGSDVTHRIVTSPNSLCGIKVVDKSVTLLDSSDQLTKDKIFQLQSNLNPPSYYGSSDFCGSDKSQPGLNPSEANSKVNPIDSFYSSSYEDSYAAFQDAGFLVISNLVLFSRPCSRGSPVAYGAMAFGVPAAMPMNLMAAPQAASMSRNAAISYGPGGPGVTQSVVEVRNFFPETWLFELQMTGPDGSYSGNSNLPHTITEWDGSAVCINPQEGVGLSDMASIKAFQAFFISYTLPISVIREEEFEVIVSVFNYVDAALPISVNLKDPKGFTVTNGLSNSDICIQPSTSESLKMTLKATTVGTINITVEASTASSNKSCGDSPVYGGYARDAITQALEVEAEGFLNEKVYSTLFCPADEENKTFQQSDSLSLPADAVPDSARALIDVSGNVMGPALQNLNNLVSLPTGCGEQNMVKFTPNYLVLDYLTEIGKLTDSLKSTAIKNLNTGYQRELTYQRYDGSFSAFGNSDQEGSMFLTSFVMSSFYQAKRYITIDPRLFEETQNWITSRQQKDGCFPNVGQIIDSGIQGGLEKDKRNGTITAYVLASLLISNYKNQTVIRNAITCLSKNPPSSPYETFLYAYAEALAGKRKVAQTLLDDIKPFVETKGGLEFYHNPNETKALDVETNAYAVLANLQLGKDKSSVLPLVRYLSTNLNPSGGFYSTQDTCVGLSALSKFAKIVYKDPVNIHVSISGGLNEQVQINEDNKLLVQRNEIYEIPSELNVEATGSGCGLLQSSLRYNTYFPPDKNMFHLNILGECTSSDCKQRKITGTISYAPEGKKAGMSVVQVKMVTGTVAMKESLDELTSDSNNDILRTDIEDNNVNIYFKEISNYPELFSFDVQEIVKVENPQPGTAKVFDYYAPENSASTSYTYETSE